MLAINGGTPIRIQKWPCWPIWDEQTLKQLEQVLQSGRWAISGQWKGIDSKCMKFEKKFAEFNNIEYCVTTTNGSSSLLIALESLGIGAGDEVIVPALTWVATAISVCDVNAVPVFVDVDAETYCISIEEVQKAITPRTKAIIPVHLYGCMADMGKLVQFAKEKNVFIIEDASHSHGSMWNGQYAGTLGDVGAFSLQQGKVLTSGEGGVLLTRKKDIYHNAIELRSNSRIYVDSSQLKIDKMQLTEKGTIMGTNHCLSEFQAAILLDQLERLEELNRIKEKNAIYLNQGVSNIPGISIMFRHPNVQKQSYYRYAVRVDTRYFANKKIQSICNALEAELNIVVEPPYKPLHLSPLYRPWTKKRYSWSEEYLKSLSTDGLKFPISEKAAQNEGIVIHHSTLLGDRKDMNDIISAFEKVQKLAYTI